MGRLRIKIAWIGNDQFELPLSYITNITRDGSFNSRQIYTIQFNDIVEIIKIFDDDMPLKFGGQRYVFISYRETS